MPAPTEPITSPVSAHDRLQHVQAQITAAASAADRQADQITLVAISKTHPEAAILPVLESGHRVFGENRVQEAAAKWPNLRARYPDLELHLVGPLQTNKVRDAVQLFDVIETVDRPKLAAALARESERSGHSPRCYVQVNTGNEPQKAGIAPTDVDEFVALCRDQHGLPIEGLMCIPPVDEEPSLHFALLAKFAARNNLPVLSMGMSSDFEIAIKFGATHVRVGTAIFGPRQKI